MFSHQSMIVLLTALYTELSWGLPTSLFILLCHSVTAWSISSSYVSSKRGLKYLSYDLKYPHTRFFIWPYEHQSYSYSPSPRNKRLKCTKSLTQVSKLGLRWLTFELASLVKPRFNGFPCKSGIFSREGTNLSRASIAPCSTAVSPRLVEERSPR